MQLNITMCNNKLLFIYLGMYIRSYICTHFNLVPSKGSFTIVNQNSSIEKK